MSFFNITYPCHNHNLKHHNLDLEYDLYTKQQCTEETKEDKKLGVAVFAGEFFQAHQLEMEHLLIKSKIQVLRSYINIQHNDWEIFNNNLKEEDLNFIAKIMINTDPSYDPYKEEIRKSRAHLPGYLDHQLSMAIHAIIESWKNNVSASSCN